MNDGTCIMLLLFYIFRYYKRVGIKSNKKELISDLKNCRLLLKRMTDDIPLDMSIDIVNAVINRLNSFGYSMKLQIPLRYADAYDHDILMMMIWLVDEISSLAKCPFYRRCEGQIFKRFLVLHNLPRVLLNDSSGDSSTLDNFHVSKQDALAGVSALLGDDWKNKRRIVL